MPRLIHLAEYTPLHDGSFIPFMSSVLNEGGARGWDTEVVLPGAAEGREWLADVEATGARIRFISGNRRELSRAVSKLLDESDEPTILHTHFTTYDLAAVAALRGHPQASVYWHVHTVLSTSRTVIAGNMAKFATAGRRVERILCPSSNIAEGVSRRLGPSDRISVFPSPIEIESFPLLGEKRDEARLELGVPADAEVLLLFGRAWMLKGGDVFLRALELLRGQGRNVFAVVNQGGEEAREEIARMGLGESAAVVGPVPDVRTVFAAADVFVAPSQGEGMPFAVIEALCSGIPVVASDLPGHRFVADHLDACTISSREPEALAGAIAEYLDAPAEVVSAQCRAARDWIAANLDLTAATSRLVGYYEETFAKRQGRIEA